ncbi:MAG: signal peptidase I [Solirubrobacteraceae bacterium]|nr:signal peptidase I [Solirubrobacteraceae bacterium]
MARPDQLQVGGPPPTFVPAPAAKPKPKRPERGKLWHAATLIPFLAFSIAVIAVLTSLKPYRIISGSMAPTADVGQRVFADHVGGGDGWNPKAGDIIVFKAPGGARDDSPAECAQARQPHTACLEALQGRTDISFVKRVVGLPGDRLRIVHGHVIRNGHVIDEPYARTCDDEACNIAEFSVPQGHYFVLGDNRGDSSDSRYWGPITHDEIVGRIVATYWPLSRIGTF